MTPRTVPLVVAAAVLATPLLAAVAPALAADPDVGEVSRIDDPRIKESSGLAVSPTTDDLVYTINDAGNAPIVYAVTISTGKVVGTTAVEGGPISDTESIAIDSEGTMWLADLGDNDAERDDVALYSFEEPGPGDHTVTAERYAVTYAEGPVDVEALLVHPKTGAKFLASKDKKKPGTLFSLPDTLSTTQPNLATDLGKPVPEDVSDATYTLDGSQALIRTRDAVHVFDPQTWQEIRVLKVPKVEQGESISMEPSGTSFLIGSEGKRSPLIRVAYDPGTSDDATPTPASTDEPTPAPAETSSAPAPAWLVLGGGLAAVAALGAIAWLVTRRR